MNLNTRIKEVMRAKNCSYSEACRWLGKRSAEARLWRKRAAERMRMLEERERMKGEAMGWD